jgi:hypothetical protein
VAVNGRVVAAGFYQGDGAGLRLGDEFHHNPPGGGTRSGSTRRSCGSRRTAGSTPPDSSPISFRCTRRRPRTRCSTAVPTRHSRWC